jgi:flagellar L-ring protein precursor FlgH
MKTIARLSFLATLGLLAACSSTSPPSLVTGPTSARPSDMISSLDDRNPGAIFQSETARLLYEEAVAHHIGDTLTIQITENLTGSNSTSVNGSQTSSETLKGPGALASMSGFLKTLFNINMSGSSSEATKASGQDSSSHVFAGTLTVSIVDILPNGNFVVGGDKRVAMDGNEYALRFSGIVNRNDIHAGNVVDSSKVADARIEKVGQGLVADANSLGWMQRFFLSVMGFN